MSNQVEHFFFCGIGGSGMSALARAALHAGCDVAGSDRLFDQGGGQAIRASLEAEGILVLPQDGEALNTFPATRLVVSSAVEPSVPDVKAALDMGVPIIKRAELLAEMVNGRRGVAVGGTSGKSTVTAMLGHLSRETGLKPTVINGAVMLNSTPRDGLGNAWCGEGDIWVVEADESDGSIALYQPAVSVLTTVSEDHLPLPELRRLFADFAGKARLGAVVNADCAEAAALAAVNPDTRTFGIHHSEADFFGHSMCYRPDGVDFVVNGYAVNLPVPGGHNVLNALAALAAVSLLGVPMADAVSALASFKGVKRRLQLVGTSSGGVTVIDDFAHNPEKIAAALAALRQFPGRLIVFYQPHGFGPVKMLRKGLVDAFRGGLSADDALLMPEIFYAGGTAKRDISSKDLLDDIGKNSVQTRFCPSREDTIDWLVANARRGDRVIVMGARDPSLAEFAESVLAVL
ncbi:MAG: Mur ligase family protein [Lentisphaeria bacterium]|nr:Mur ligase family protein [Lentisphaeria bacterium]